MFLSFLVPILSGILGASTATAVVGTVSSAVTAVATASAGEVLAVAGTTVATVGLVGAAKGMSENAKRNKCETRRIYKKINDIERNREIKLNIKHKIIEFIEQLVKQADSMFMSIVTNDDYCMEDWLYIMDKIKALRCCI